MKPPAIAEAMLAGLIPNRDARDEVLGNLAEEWHTRAGRDGRARANAWYASEALRTSPHLLHLWWRSVSLPVIGVVVVAACVLRLVLAAAGYLALFGVMAGARFLGLPLVFTSVASVGALVLAAFAVAAVVVQLDRRAPLVTLAIVGVIALVTGVQSESVIGATFLHPAQYWIVANVLATPLLLAGAGLALRRRAVAAGA